MRDKIAPAIERSRTLPQDELPAARREVIEDLLRKLSLPEALKQDLRRRHGL